MSRMSISKPVKLVIIEDSNLVVTRIQRELADHENIVMSGFASSGEAGIQLVCALKPDIVLLDFYLPDSHGDEIARRILEKRPKQRIIIVTVIAAEVLSRKMLSLGVKGYVEKGAVSGKLAEAITAVMKDEIYLSEPVALQFQLPKHLNDCTEVLGQLSEQELRILKLLAHGQAAKAIGHQLHISPKTVYSYRERIFQKLEILNDLELRVFALRHKLIGMN